MINRRLILTTCTTLCSCALSASAQTQVPGQQDHSTRDVDTSSNHPVDPKVADRGVLTMPGRQMPYELAMPQGFDRVYSVPGQAGMFYRANGGLFLVFDQGEYKQDKKGNEYAMVPAGAVYYIGKPDWSRIVRKSKVAAGAIGSQQDIRVRSELASAKDPSSAKRQDEVDTSSLAVQAKRDFSVRAPTEQSSPTVPKNEVGFGNGSAQLTTSTDSIIDPKPAEFQSKAPDAAAWAGTLPAGVDCSFLVGTGENVQPRMLVDFLYRQERLSKLFQLAASSAQQK